MNDISNTVLLVFCFVSSMASSLALISLIFVLYKTKRIKQLITNDILMVIEGGLKRYEYDYDGFKKYYRKKLKRQLKDYMNDTLY